MDSQVQEDLISRGPESGLYPEDDGEGIQGENMGAGRGWIPIFKGQREVEGPRRVRKQSQSPWVSQQAWVAQHQRGLSTACHRWGKQDRGRLNACLGHAVKEGTRTRTHSSNSQPHFSARTLISFVLSQTSRPLVEEDFLQAFFSLVT